MNWIARIIGAVLGYLMAGPFGALVGYVAGYFFDRAFARFQSQFDPEKRAEVELSLFNSIFPLLGHLAKADGRVSENEIQTAEVLMTRLQLGAEQRQQAIALFKRGTAPEFDSAATVQDFLRVCSPYPNVKQILLVYLISMAMSDGAIDTAEEGILRKISAQLGYPPVAFEHMMRMARAQQQFHQGAGRAPPTQDALATAYEALGVEPSIGDADLKRVYRKLMSENHPDKLAGQGVPDDMIRVATERSQDIQAAYDLIKKHR